MRRNVKFVLLFSVVWFGGFFYYFSATTTAATSGGAGGAGGSSASGLGGSGTGERQKVRQADRPK